MPLVFQGELLYGYRVQTGVDSRCYVRIYDLVGVYADPTKVMVAVYCELSHSAYQGLSVTNGAEYIVAELWERNCLHPERTLYVEHYPDETPAYVKARKRAFAIPSRFGAEETFDLVQFRWETFAQWSKFQFQASNPQWRAISRMDLEALIGAPFARLPYEHRKRK